MASFKYNAKAGRARLHFRYRGQQFNRTIRAATAREAERACALIEETIEDLKRGRLQMPPEADPAEFIYSGGRVATTTPKALSPIKALTPAEDAKKPPTVKRVFDTYFENLTPGSKEANSLNTEAVHRRHFARHFGERLRADDLGVDAVQRYVDARAREGVGRETIRKELSTLRVIWNWAFKRRHVGSAPAWKMADLTFPKADEKPPFQTWDQIVRKVERGGLTKAQQERLWECLWLDEAQTMEFLAWAREAPGPRFLYPMLAFAIYTGARRGEIARSERDDWDFEGGFVTIRQKKADKAKKFTRRNVPIHPALAEVMREWFRDHPGGPWTFCKEDGAPIVPMSVTKALRHAVRGSKWAVLHGWHTFRHSLASNMASAGKDQRVISEILGHHTEEMERRYRHLLPRKQQDAINDMFRSAEAS